MKANLKFGNCLFYWLLWWHYMSLHWLVP